MDAQAGLHLCCSQNPKDWFTLDKEKIQKVSEYAPEMPQSQTTDKSTAP